MLCVCVCVCVRACVRACACGCVCVLCHLSSFFTAIVKGLLSFLYQTTKRYLISQQGHLSRIVVIHRIFPWRNCFASSHYSFLIISIILLHLPQLFLPNSCIRFLVRVCRSVTSKTLQNPQKCKIGLCYLKRWKWDVERT